MGQAESGEKALRVLRGTKGYLEYYGHEGTKGREGTRVLRGTKGYDGHEGTKGRKLARGTQGAKDSTDERKMRIQFRKTAATLNVSALVLPMRLYLPCHAAVPTACDCYSVVALHGVSVAQDSCAFTLNRPN